jgi:hypothetical protein
VGNNITDYDNTPEGDRPDRIDIEQFEKALIDAAKTCMIFKNFLSIVKNIEPIEMLVKIDTDKK